MSKKKLFLYFAVLITVILIFFSARDAYIEYRMEKCIAGILIEQNIKKIEFSTKNRVNKPIIKGMLNPLEKNKLYAKLYRQCNIVEIQDFIETTEPVKEVYSAIRFQIDHVNNIINISGVAKNQTRIDNILSSFKTAIQNNMPASEIPWTLSPDISINNQVDDVDFPVMITLLFSAIDNIRLTDITLDKKKVILKGLVRDKIREQETLSLVNQLFDDEFTIVNQLELVVRFIPDFQDIEINSSSPPILDHSKIN